MLLRSAEIEMITFLIFLHLKNSNIFLSVCQFVISNKFFDISISADSSSIGLILTTILLLQLQLINCNSNSIKNYIKFMCWGFADSCQFSSFYNIFQKVKMSVIRIFWYLTLLFDIEKKFKNKH